MAILRKNPSLFHVSGIDLILYYVKIKDLLKTIQWYTHYMFLMLESDAFLQELW